MACQLLTATEATIIACGECTDCQFAVPTRRVVLRVTTLLGDNTDRSRDQERDGTRIGGTVPCGLRSLRCSGPQTLRQLSELTPMSPCQCEIGRRTSASRATHTCPWRKPADRSNRHPNPRKRHIFESNRSTNLSLQKPPRSKTDDRSGQPIRTEPLMNTDER